jgi:sugar transferase (PEP-CTERM/EpsH1 system associated)
MSTSAPLIAHVIHRLDVGGLENGVINLVNRMPRDRYRHAVICLSGANPQVCARIERSDVEVVSLDKRPGKDPAAYVRTWRTLRRLRPTIVHTRNLGTIDVQWVAVAAGIPARVHGEHGWDASDPKGVGRKGQRIRRACWPAIHRYVPMSQDIARWLETSVGVPRSRIRQVYSGVDTDRFTSSAPIAQEGGRGGMPITIGTVGRLDPVKNQESLLRSFATLRRQGHNVRLAIVGDGPLRETLVSTAHRLGIAEDVAFAGARADVAELLRDFDVFVLPSHNEGISNTILEAMATGLPVVATRVGGNPELVSDGATGCLYDPADPDGLESALLPYLRDATLRRTHGSAGRARVVQDFSLSAMVRRYLEMYDELVTAVPARGRKRSG